MKRDRGDLLSGPERKALTAFVRLHGPERVAKATGRAVGTAGQWLKSEVRIGHGPHTKLRILLGLDLPEVIASTPGAELDLSSPIGQIEKLYNDARYENFQRFDPLTAAYHVASVVNDPRLLQAPPVWVLERLIVCIAILRQSTHTGLESVTAVANKCIERLSRISDKDKKPPLAALCAAVACELAGLVVQRGDAMKGAEMLEAIVSLMRACGLIQDLSAQRLRSIYRMWQWAWEVSNPNIKQARTIASNGGGIMTQIEKLVVDGSAETFSTKHQQFAALNRQALANVPGADDKLVHFFETGYGQSFSKLASNVEKDGLLAHANEVTPTTALAISLNITLMANHLRRRGDERLIRSASILHQQVISVADEGVLLQRSNEQTTGAAAMLRVGPYRNIAPIFEFTPNLQPRATRILGNYVDQLLKLVRSCSKHSIVIA